MKRSNRKNSHEQFVERHMGRIQLAGWLSVLSVGCIAVKLVATGSVEEATTLVGAADPLVVLNLFVLALSIGWVSHLYIRWWLDDETEEEFPKPPSRPKWKLDEPSQLFSEKRTKSSDISGSFSL